MLSLKRDWTFTADKAFNTHVCGAEASALIDYKGLDFPSAEKKKKHCFMSENNTGTDRGNEVFSLLTSNPSAAH